MILHVTFYFKVAMIRLSWRDLDSGKYRSLEEVLVREADAGGGNTI